MCGGSAAYRGNLHLPRSSLTLHTIPLFPARLGGGGCGTTPRTVQQQPYVACGAFPPTPTLLSVSGNASSNVSHRTSHIAHLLVVMLTRVGTDDRWLIRVSTDGGCLLTLVTDDAAQTGAHAGGICGYGLATSRDGVHWVDHGLGAGMLPFDTTAVGSGSVYLAPKNTRPKTPKKGGGGAGGEAGAGRSNAGGGGNETAADDDVWVVNYSEADADGAGNQAIRFQTTSDPSLMGGWTPCRAVPPFAPNTTAGYSNSRWDTITTALYVAKQQTKGRGCP